MHRRRKQKRQRACENVSNGGGGGIFTAQVIDNKNGGVNIGRGTQGLSDDDRGVGRGRERDEASRGSETTVEVAGDQRQAQGIYDNGRDVVEGR